ncbi:MAG: histidine phosphatase family protein [Polaromonas sp.]|nr:histidine phosphatase family protein [Polaromonas sp.]
MQRRSALLTLGAAASWPFAQAQPAPTGDPAALLKAGACVVMLRHAQTEPGIGDPPEFRIDQCSTQRNLSEAGRVHSRRIGQWFAARNLTPAAVQSSAWCRCKDTAELAFGRFTVLPALNSTFAGQGDERAATPALRERLRRVAAGQFEVWVTHQVNITALTGEVPAMGEAYILDASGTIRARTLFA